MRQIETAIGEVSMIVPDVVGDLRGFFVGSYHEVRFRNLGVDMVFAQDNHSDMAEAE